MKALESVQKGTGVILFYRPHCPYCQYLMPLWNTVKERYKNSILFEEVDINQDAQKLKAAFGFATVPTVIYYKNGTEVARHGSNNMAVTEKEMENYILTLIDPE